MKPLALFAALLLPLADVFALGGPVFIGTTGDYLTNTSGTITFVFSNRTQMVFSRSGTAPLVRITNSIAGQSHTINFGTGDENTSVRLDFSMGTSGGGASGFSWEWLFHTNAAILAMGDGTLPLSVTKSDTLITPSSSFAMSGFKLTNGIANLIESATRTGGALTNVTLNAQGAAVVHVNGATNVNLVAIMNWVAGLQRPITLLVTNRTATPTTFSFGATTNNFIGMGSITGPISVTNAIWVAIENLGTSNCVYAAQYISNPSN